MPFRKLMRVVSLIVLIISSVLLIIKFIAQQRLATLQARVAVLYTDQTQLLPATSLKKAPIKLADQQLRVTQKFSWALVHHEQQDLQQAEYQITVAEKIRQLQYHLWLATDDQGQIMINQWQQPEQVAKLYQELKVVAPKYATSLTKPVDQIAAQAKALSLISDSQQHLNDKKRHQQATIAIMKVTNPDFRREQLIQLNSVQEMLATDDVS